MLEFLGRSSDLNGTKNAFCDQPTGDIGTLERGARINNAFEQVAELSAYLNFKELRDGKVFGDACFDERHKVGDELRGVIQADGSIHFGWGLWPGSGQNVAAIVGWKGYRMRGLLTYCETTRIETRWHYGPADAIHCEWFGEVSNHSPAGFGEEMTCQLGDSLHTRGRGADAWLIVSNFCVGAAVDERVCFKPVPH
jgi:hypothetical protein